MPRIVRNNANNPIGKGSKNDTPRPSPKYSPIHISRLPGDLSYLQGSDIVSFDLSYNMVIETLKEFVSVLHNNDIRDEV